MEGLKDYILTKAVDCRPQNQIPLGMFYLSGVGVSFFLTLLLLSKKNKSSADKILTVWLVVITVHLLLFYFRKEGIYPELMGIEIPFPLMHGPFLFLYTLALTNRSSSWKISPLHFLPVILCLIYIAPFLSLPVSQKIFVYRNKGIGYETFSMIKSITIIVSGVGYVIASSMVLRVHGVLIANQFSNSEKVNLQWLQFLIYWIAVIWLLVIFTNDDWVFAAAVLFVSFIGFFGIRQVGIFHEPNILTEEGDSKNGAEATVEKTKYKKSGLDAASAELLHRQLIEAMNTRKLYCRNELSLSELAQSLEVQPNYLSQVINEREGKNFYDYINSLRIEEFKRLASAPESRKYTLVALAQQCGFNSKSSFHRYFKKATGQSPSEFIETLSGPQK